MPCTEKENTMKGFKALFVVAALSLTALAVSAGSALANTAANTQITNQAKLTYTGGSAQAQVTVNVLLVPSNPNVIISSGTATYSGPNTPLIPDTVTITSTANGPASYTITASIPNGGTTNVLASNPASLTATTQTQTVTIGATVSTGTSSTTYVTVPQPASVSGSGSVVNGIGIGSNIVFTVNGHTYTEQVTSTTDKGDGTFQIGWLTAIPAADIPTVGVLVAEQKAVIVNVQPGTVQTAGTPITVNVSAQVTGGISAVPVTTAAPNNWTTPNPSVTFTKYVRNITNPVAGGGLSPLTVNTVTSNYYTSGVTAKPGDLLEYVVVATNNGVSDLTGSAISDLIPTAYVTLTTGGYSSRDVFYIDPTGATSSFTAAAVGANQASYVAANNPNLIVNVGTGASSSATGTIPAGKSVTIAYQVTVK